MRIIALIPSRLGSTRLPNKPLADICGKPMIAHVLERALEAGYRDVYIAAAEREIIDVIEKFGGKGIMTDPGLPSGTDRIYQALQKLPERDNIDIIINIQGDLPTIDPLTIKHTVELAISKGYDITTAVAEITDDSEKTNPNIVKAVVSWKNPDRGKALYFTRSTCPSGEGALYHHIGLYVYTKAALEKFVRLPQSQLEKREKLEQLRALENDMKIGVIKTGAVPLGVDTAEDLEKARKILSCNK